jgi:HSP20 family protein
MRTLNRFEPFRGVSTLQEQLNRLFSDGIGRAGEDSSLTTWAPAVDIYETEHELVVKADLPEVDPKDLDIRVENNILTLRGERKFESTSPRISICAWSAPTDRSAAASLWPTP